MTLAELRKQEKALLEKRAKIVNDQKSLYTVAQGEGRGLNPEETQRYEKFDADWSAVEVELRSVKDMADREETSQRALDQYRSDSERNGGWEQNSTEQPTQAQSYRNAFYRYLQGGEVVLSHEERKALSLGADKEQRAQTVTTTGGGYLIPTDLASQLEVILKYYGPMMDGAVTGELLTSRGNTINYPTLNDTTNTGRLLGINTQVTETAMTFGNVAFDAYKFSSDLVLVPNELLEDSDFNIDTVVNETLAERLGRVLNTYLTTGTGSSQPNGVVTASAAGVTAAGSTAFLRDEIVGLVHSVDRAYRNGPKVGFMFHDNILAAIKKLTIGGGGGDSPLWQPSIRVGEPDRLEGFQFWVNNDMASAVTTGAKVMLFGDFSKYKVRKVSGIRLMRMPERYGDYDQTGYVGFMRVDGDLIASSAIKRLTMA